MTSLLLHNADALHTCDDARTVIPGGFVHVVDGRIAALGGPSDPLPEADERIDLSRCAVMPGFVNVHHHFFQTLTKAIPRVGRAHALDWLFGCYPLWAELDGEDMYWASALAAAELVLSGATTSADHSYLIPRPADVAAANQFRAAGEIGLRLHLVHGCLPTLEADLAERLRAVMGDHVDTLLDDEEAMFAPMEASVRRFHDPAPFAMTRVALGPTGITYSRPHLMRRIADLAERHGLGLHTHYHPRQVERDMALALVGKTPLAFLEETGWLRPGTWFAHCTELNDAEIAAFARAGAGIAHCPRTVLRLGYQVTRIAAMRAGGVQVGIGVDGPASNDFSSMIHEIRLAHVLNRAATPGDVDPRRAWLTPEDTLEMATRAGAAILGRDDIGQLKPGLAADITAFRVDGLDLAGTVGDAVSGLVLSGTAARAHLTVVNGRVVVRDGRLATLDEAVIAREASRRTRGLVDRASRRTGFDFTREP